MNLKDGVKVQGLTNEILIGWLAAKFVYLEIGKQCTMTAGLDGSHMRKSKHFSGNAVDLRTRHLSDAQKAVVVDKLREALTSDYDVILHDTHIHLEYDPKGV